MPTVRRAEREVATAPIPGVRKQSASTAIAEGAGIEQARANVGEAIAGFGGAVARVGIGTYSELAQESRRRADTVATLEADRKLGQWEISRLYSDQGTKVAALNRRGKDAMGLPEELREEFEQVAGEIEKGLATDRQREAFARVKANRGLSLDMTIQRHVFTEMNRHAAEELEATLEVSRSAAGANALDPARVGLELARGVEAIKEVAPRFMGAKAVEAKVLKFTTEAHAEVIDRLLANDKDKAAKIYFEEARDAGQIDGKVIGRIEKALDEGSLRGESQRKADEIIATGKTFAEQRELAKGIEDDKLRDAVEQRIEHNKILVEREEREKDEAVLTNAFNIVDRYRDVTKIPPSVWSNLPGSARASLRSYAEHLAKGIPVKTDLATYYSLIDEAAKNPEKFANRSDLLSFRGKLDEVEFKKIADLQYQLRTGARKEADKTLEGFSTNEQIWAGILVETGIKKDSPEAVALRKEIERRVETFQEDTGRKIKDTELREMAANLTGQVVLEPGGWANIFPGGAPFNDRTKRAVDITVADIPTQQRSAVEERLKKAGVKVTPESVVDYWLRAKRALGEIK